jgi:CelD/BcsL family acetyltransferase involved in cellulose biosynthesis
MEAMTVIKWIDDVAELDAIRDTWMAMERANGNASVFQSWQWNRIWCDQVLRFRNGRLKVGIAQDSAGKVLAILPFFKAQIVGPMLHAVQFLGHRMSYHNDVLLADPSDRALAAKVVSALLAHLGTRDILHLRHLADSSLFTKELVRRGLALPMCTRLHVRDDPLISDQTSRLGRCTRKRVRNQRNKLTRDFGVEFRCHTRDALLPAFEELLRLHYLRSRSIGRSSLLNEQNVAFHRAVLASQASDRFEIIELRTKERVIASTLMARDQKRYYGMTAGFDPEFSPYTPMRLLLTEVMGRAFTDLGCEFVDFGPGYESYKYEWSPVVGSNYLCCAGVGAYARLSAVLVREMFLRNLPKTQLEKFPVARTGLGLTH